MTDAAAEAWIGDVLGFWFEELGRKAWFGKDPCVDRKIRERFERLYEVLTARPAGDALAGAERALASVIVLDQFPRNLFRDNPKAFATDALAREVAERAIAERVSTGRSRRSGGFSSICRLSIARMQATRRAQLR